ncbi:MAG: hypothetical protein IPJ61_08620 [Tessaracoccus sp.]|uniref:FtsX-like permease family protein n=1 Tax=Tessaracoccus sp. TaxID=1971211 RepID=UPI001EB40441|nr:FtsX-like permease family protein [Tessaracoccus sp.]MBK7821124.1 hypothetical protein [Tessaracoccus sp.]
MPTVLILLVTAAMTFAAAATSGRSAALQTQLERRAQEAGARVIAISDVGTDGFLTPVAVETLSEISSIQTVAAFTKASTVTNASLGWGGPTASAWGLVGASAADVVDLTAGRWPQPGEALVSTRVADTLRMESAAGALVTRDQLSSSVVGAFTAAAPFEWLNDGVLYLPSTPEAGQEARVVVEDIGLLAPTERAVRRILAPDDPANMRLTSPQDLAEISREIDGDVRAAGYEITVLVLLVGALFVGAVSLADVLIRRRDLGRRRALGMTRSDLTALICLRVGISAASGAVLGVIALQAHGALSGTSIPVASAAASAALVAIAAVVATVPAALISAGRDPVVVLRTA